jgi:hypothetical protein
VVSIACDDATEADFPSLFRRCGVDEAVWQQSKRDQGRNHAPRGLTCSAVDRKTEPRFSSRLLRNSLLVRSGDGSPEDQSRRRLILGERAQAPLAPFD